MLKSVINLLYPAASGVCPEKIKKRLPPFCIKCGRQLNSIPEPIDICADCRNDAPYFDRAWSACCYEEPLKGLIHDFKYKHITYLSKDFSKLIIDFMQQHNVAAGSELILSVPMHPGRLFKREVNHSDMLAKDIARRMDIPYSGKILKKIKNTSIQSTLKREERIKNLHSSFSIKNTSAVRGKNILLVDDLFTTGSTVNECSRILKESGAARIEVITLARGDKP
ncbi:MAG: ComF family protein [Candidatus Omnitrophota bacterium]|nr:ComF family protein [Candidatus Omnitrophota bacterium]